MLPGLIDHVQSEMQRMLICLAQPGIGPAKVPSLQLRLLLHRLLSRSNARQQRQSTRFSMTDRLLMEASQQSR